MQRFLPFFLCAPLYFSSKNDSKLSNTMSKLLFVHQSHFIHAHNSVRLLKWKSLDTVKMSYNNIVQKISYKVL